MCPVSGARLEHFSAMHTVELLEEAIELAQRAGFSIRSEWLAGRGTGWCELKGQKWLFLDLSETPREQLERVTQCLQLAAAGDRRQHEPLAASRARRAQSRLNPDWRLQNALPRLTVFADRGHGLLGHECRGPDC